MKRLPYLRDYPEIIKEWDYVLNTVNIDDILSSDKTEYFWVCDKGHSWSASPYYRISHNVKCPVCSGKRVIEGVNDLASLRPDIVEDWDKSNTLNPKQVTSKSNKYAVWKCKKCGYVYKMKISNHVSGEGCPVCAGKVVVKGINDFGTKHPELISEWDYELNDKTPYEYSEFSHKKVHWVCQFGHKWVDTLAHRSAGRGCSKCNRLFQTSFGEQAILFYIKQLYPDAIGDYRIDGFQWDVFIPSLNIFIEHDGKSFHGNTVRDKEHDEYARNNGYKLYRIVEISSDSIIKDELKIKYNSNRNKSLGLAIKELLNTLDSSNDIDVNIQRDMIRIKEQYHPQYKHYVLTDDGVKKINENRYKNSLEYLFPDIAKEWYQPLNGTITPSDISAFDHLSYYWKCEHGHIYRARVSNRTCSNSGCPKCSGREPVTGKTDFATLHESALKFWDYSKNTVLPSNVTAQSHIKIYAKCPECGYEWVTNVQKLSKRKRCNKCKTVINK